MKTIFKIFALLIFCSSSAFAIVTTKVATLPYSFVSGDYVEETSAKFVVYADDFKNTASLGEGVEAIFKKAKDANVLAQVLVDEKELSLAQEILLGLGEFSALKFTYTIFDGDNMLALFENAKGEPSYILINKEGKWDVANKSPLYVYFAENAKKIVFDKEVKKESNIIELLCADLTLLDTSLDAELLETNEIFFYFSEVYDAFFAKDFDTFRTFLDSNSADSFDEIVDGSIDKKAIAKCLSKELKEKREYLNLANLGDIFVVFYNSKATPKAKAQLSFAFLRDISCGVEIMNFGQEPDPVLKDFISR